MERNSKGREREREKKKKEREKKEGRLEKIRAGSERQR